MLNTALNLVLISLSVCRERLHLQSEAEAGFKRWRQGEDAVHEEGGGTDTRRLPRTFTSSTEEERGGGGGEKGSV